MELNVTLKLDTNVQPPID